MRRRKGNWSTALLACLALLLANQSVSQAQSPVIQVRPVDRELLTQEPREVVALAFAVSNTTHVPVELEPRLVLPRDWRPVTRELPFVLAGGEAATRLTSFMIPESALAGEYTVTYEVRGRVLPEVRDSYSVMVVVRAAPKLQALVLETPSFAVAGERYKTEFLVRNTGNATIDARYKLRSALGAQLDQEGGALKLDPGASHSIAIEAIAPEVRGRSSEHLSLVVDVPESSVTATAVAALQVLPRISAEQAYRTLPTRLDLSLLSRNVDGKRSNGWQAEWSGAGALDDDGKHQLSFVLRGPSAREFGAFGAFDEYWLRYDGKDVAATVGDYIYGLSWLTEPGRYARGARIDVERDTWGLSAYQAQERFTAARPEQRGFNAHYVPVEGARLDFNLLDRSGGSRSGTVRSVRGQALWFDGLSTAVEIGQSTGEGEHNEAFQVNLYDSRYAVDYYLMGWRADPGYLGYLRDEQYWMAGFNYPRAGWGLHGYYRLQDRNLDRDPSRPAPETRHANLGIDRALSTNTNLTLELNARALTDPYAGPGIDNSNNAARVRLSRRFEKASALYMFERGRTHNAVLGTSFDSTMHLFSAHWQASEAQAYGISASREQGGISGESSGPQSSLGLSASYRLPGEISVSMDLQRNRTPTRRFTTGNAWLSYDRADGTRWSLMLRHTDGRLPQTDAMFTYSVPFALPIARRSGVSTVRGRVYDAETGAGVRNVVLNLGGLTAVTSADGGFTFPAVRAGNHQLSIDHANIGVERVPQASFPLDLVVSRNEPREIDIALVRSITIDVSVALQARQANETAGTSAAPSVGVTGAPRVLVVFQNGEREYRRLTDPEGRVRVAGLPPGEWVVSLAPETIPEQYKATARVHRLSVEPGASATASFELDRVVREIRMLPPLELR